jgi:hypothetical protein
VGIKILPLHLFYDIGKPIGLGVQIRPMGLKERVRNSLTRERRHPACIFIAGGTPALPGISKWASYLRLVPKSSIFSDYPFNIVNGFYPA